MNPWKMQGWGRIILTIDLFYDIVYILWVLVALPAHNDTWVPGATHHLAQRHAYVNQGRFLVQ